MGWEAYNQGKLSAYDGDLGCVEAKIRQIIQKQEKKKRSKEDKKNGRYWRVRKSKKSPSGSMSSIISGSRPATVSVYDSQEEDINI